MRILVVDDEIAILGCLERLLTDAGHEVCARLLAGEEDAEGIVSVAALMQFDAAAVDLLMPAVSGDILTRQLRKVSPATRLVLMGSALSTLPDELLREVLTTSTVDDLLPLPFDSKEELLERIEGAA
jgi:DNA-binding response OmpR family regulator